MTAAEITTRIAALEARIAVFAGVSEHRFSDQSTRYDLDAAHKELARLKELLSLTENSTGRTRYAVVSKGA